MSASGSGESSAKSANFGRTEKRRMVHTPTKEVDTESEWEHVPMDPQATMEELAQRAARSPLRDERCHESRGGALSSEDAPVGSDVAAYDAVGRRGERPRRGARDTSRQLAEGNADGEADGQEGAGDVHAVTTCGGVPADTESGNDARRGQADGHTNGGGVAEAGRPAATTGAAFDGAANGGGATNGPSSIASTAARTAAAAAVGYITQRTRDFSHPRAAAHAAAGEAVRAHTAADGAVAAASAPQLRPCDAAFVRLGRDAGVATSTDDSVACPNPDIAAGSGSRYFDTCHHSEEVDRDRLASWAASRAAGDLREVSRFEEARQSTDQLHSRRGVSSHREARAVSEDPRLGRVHGEVRPLRDVREDPKDMLVCDRAGQGPTSREDGLPRGATAHIKRSIRSGIESQQKLAMFCSKHSDCMLSSDVIDQFSSQIASVDQFVHPNAQRVIAKYDLFEINRSCDCRDCESESVDLDVLISSLQQPAEASSTALRATRHWPRMPNNEVTNVSGLTLKQLFSVMAGLSTKCEPRS